MIQLQGTCIRISRPVSSVCAALVFASCLALAANVRSEMVSYEATSLPELDVIAPWIRSGSFGLDRWLENGAFFQRPEQGNWPWPHGEEDYYRRCISEIAGSESWYLEWRVQTDGPREFIPVTAPCALAAYDLLGSWYRFVIAGDQVEFIRDLSLPILYFDIAPNVDHAYRLEIEGTREYRLLIDGRLVDAGTPEGPYPTISSEMVWGAAYYQDEWITEWSYIRYGGPIPDAGTGDFDVDGTITLRDWYFFLDYTSGPEEPHAVGWACGDMEPADAADGDIDLADFAAFQNAFTGSD